jgi:aspartyl-tRNA(Asn)/glutamyl-tRNA(Gln) amidotransferase subunit B
MAKEIVEDMYKTGKSPQTIIEEKGLVQITDEGELIKTITSIIEANPQQLADYRGGKEKLFGFFVGQVMKATQGKANPQLVNELLKKMLAG